MAPDVSVSTAGGCVAVALSDVSSCDWIGSAGSNGSASDSDDGVVSDPAPSAAPAPVVAPATAPVAPRVLDSTDVSGIFADSDGSGDEGEIVEINPRTK